MSRRKWTPAGGATFAVLLGLSCAGVTADPEPSDPAAEVPDEGGDDLGSGGQGLPASGGMVVVVPPTSGGDMNNLGGAPASTGGTGTGGTEPEPPPGSTRCEEDSECESLPGCQRCLLDSTSFLFICQEATGLIECGAACVDTNASIEHCGECDKACATGASCTAGECVCDGGATLCNDACVDTQTDTNNCGMCGTVCEGDTPFCRDGGCVECENEGEDKCGDTCTDRQTDANNCGTCGNTCDTGAGETCQKGTCGVGICGAEQEYSKPLHGGDCDKQNRHRAIQNGHLWECGHWVGNAPPNSPNGTTAPCDSHEWCYVGPC